MWLGLLPYSIATNLLKQEPTKQLKALAYLINVIKVSILYAHKNNKLVFHNGTLVVNCGTGCNVYSGKVSLHTYIIADTTNYRVRESWSSAVHKKICNTGDEDSIITSIEAEPQ